MLGIVHDQNYLSLSLQEKGFIHLPHNFGHRMSDMIMKFMGTQSFFTPPHVIDPMDDIDDVYKSHGHTPKDVIHSMC